MKSQFVLKSLTRVVIKNGFIPVLLVLLLACETKVDQPSIAKAGGFEVTINEASVAAANIHLSDVVKSISSGKQGATKRLEAKTVKNITAMPDAGNPSYFIINYKEGGWAILAGDKRVEPVMAYAEDGEMPKIDANADIPAGLGSWLLNAHNNMLEVKQKSVGKSTVIPCQIRASWARVLNTESVDCGVTLKTQSLSNGKAAPPPPVCQSTYNYHAVGPLLETIWGQQLGYNDYCPPYPGCAHSWTGCVATAMAQVMYYWKKPATYNWASMATYYGTPETARLMYEAGKGNPYYYWRCNIAGVTWNATKYPDLASACGFQFTCDAGVTTQFKNKFGYRSASFGNYYFSTLKSNLDAGQPVILNAYRDKNCFLGICVPAYDSHTWVCDGYQTTDWYDCQCGCGGGYTMLHMNWGWENVNTAWVNENNWAVNVNLGDGGGIKNYNYFTSMYWNIIP